MSSQGNFLKTASLKIIYEEIYGGKYILYEEFFIHKNRHKRETFYQNRFIESKFQAYNFLKLTKRITEEISGGKRKEWRN